MDWLQGATIFTPNVFSENRKKIFSEKAGKRTLNDKKLNSVKAMVLSRIFILE